MNQVYREKKECYACGLCSVMCPTDAIRFNEDDEGFEYPIIDREKCIDCGKCIKSCTYNNISKKYEYNPLVFGGYNKDKYIKSESTSGGIFSAIIDAFYTGNNCYIFGAVAEGLKVKHEYVNDIKDIGRFRKSKYGQSEMGTTYQEAMNLLKAGNKVLFSGTPCQIDALKQYLGAMADTENLITIDVVCEGIPSPLLLRKQIAEIETKYNSKVIRYDYRFKDKNRWDFEVGKFEFEDGRTLCVDRWFNPFWILWSRRVMGRPSCDDCKYRSVERVGDITLGDLWGCQEYCPDLYGNNEGTGLAFCNSRKGKELFSLAIKNLHGHELCPEEALKYQRPMRTIVPASPEREAFMKDLIILDYSHLIKKWRAREPIRVIFKKYILGSNRQKVMLYKIKERVKKYKADSIF